MGDPLSLSRSLLNSLPLSYSISVRTTHKSIPLTPSHSTLYRTVPRVSLPHRSESTFSPGEGYGLDRTSEGVENISPGSFL